MPLPALQMPGWFEAVLCICFTNSGESHDKPRKEARVLMTGADDANGNEWIHAGAGVHATLKTLRTLHRDKTHFFGDV